jgi:hypothetical protein
MKRKVKQKTKKKGGNSPEVQARSNAVRRKKYHNDPSYRAKVMRRARVAWQQSSSTFAPKGFGSEAGNATSYAYQHRVIDAVGRERTVYAVSSPSMAEFIGVSGKTFQQWLLSGRFPRPWLLCVGGYCCYPIGAANALARTLNRGLAGRATFRGSDTAVIKALFETAK